MRLCRRRRGTKRRPLQPQILSRQRFQLFISRSAMSCILHVSTMFRGLHPILSCAGNVYGLALPLNPRGRRIHHRASFEIRGCFLISMSGLATGTNRDQRKRPIHQGLRFGLGLCTKDPSCCHHKRVLPDQGLAR